MTLEKIALAVCLALFAARGATAQDTAPLDSGFGFAGGSSPLGGITVGGDARLDAFALIDDLSDPEHIAVGNLASASLSFSASGDKADAYVDFSLSKLRLDEAYVRINGANLVFEGGLMKLTWGKADSQGPLDIVNPTDFSDLTVTDSLERKIARPMLHPVFSFGPMTRIEGVFVPSFVGNSYAESGQFKPAAIAALDAKLSALSGGTLSFASLDGERNELGDFQAGVRFTTTTGPVDWGAQYYYGRMREASVLYAPPVSFSVTHDRFHLAGIDLATVFAGLNLRAEAAVSLTEDLAGDDSEVRNPEFGFSVGGDREILGGLAVNVQYGGRVLAGYGEISSPRDVQAAADEFASKVTVKLSRGFFKDALSLEATAIWEVQSEDFLIVPCVSWSVGDATIELAAGVFGGKNSGELGQFKDASYVRTGVRYAF